MAAYEGNQRRFFLGMPGYGQMTGGASMGFWSACQRDGDFVHRDYKASSLLATNFNILWCIALNMQHSGTQPLDYFAMQHSDVEPEPGWLDTLTDELEANDLDMIGAAIPIKDSKGLTSLALAHPTGDPWRVKCRLTMDEVFRLPETFTSDDVGAPLLLNTGLWVCRFDPSWNDKVHFEINDRIVFDTKQNQYVVQVESEDWYFSRLFHEMGLKVGATRKVKLVHRGEAAYDNMHPWGQSYDARYIDESSLPKPPEWFPADVDGWLTEVEGKALKELAAGKNVLEIGSYCGKSTICLAQDAKHVESVDYHDGRGTSRQRNTYHEFNSNIERYGVANRISMSHPEGVIRTVGGGYDVAMIDGDHEPESVQSDIRKALDVLSPNGLLVFHDYRTTPGEVDGRWDPGVTHAVNELLEAGGKLISTHDTLAVVRPPAAVPLEV